MSESFDKRRLRFEVLALDAARVRLQSEIDSVLNGQRPSHYRLGKLIKEMTDVTKEMNRIAGHTEVVYDFTG